VIRGGVRTVVPRKVIRRAISQGTAVELTRIMEGVVTDGTGKAAIIPGYTVAGKTGTASKVMKGGGYSRSDYNVSFVGFVPSREPVFTIIVVVDTPRLLPKFGGTVSAPIFQRIADAAMRQYGVPPSIDPAPPVLVARGPSSPVEPTVGPAGPIGFQAVSAGGRPVVPDLIGASARDAVLVLNRLGVTSRLRGVGPVVAQQPPAGTPIEAGMTTTLWLERRPAEVRRSARR
jgi:membrane peptidoglycan carboxypeptidase